MKKFDKKILQLGIVLFLVAAAGILFYYFIFNNQEFLKGGAKLIRLMKPIIVGAFLAYLLAPVLNFFEKYIVDPIYNKIRNKNKKYNKSLVRAIGLTLTMALLAFSIYLLVILVVPQVIESVQSIINRMPEYFNTVNAYINKVLVNNKDVQYYVNEYNADFQKWFSTNLLPKVQDTLTTVSSGIIGGVVVAIKEVLNFIIGIIVSTYLIGKKELFCAQAKKITYALLEVDRANNLINNVRFANNTFGGFLTGKIVDSIIIGILCFIVLVIFKMPYPMLVSVIVGVTNIIPYFGPFLGAIPSAILILMVSPVKCLTFLIIVVVLQQIDGNIIGPKILGNSTGLSSFWVIFAITLFGGYFGVFGMFIGVPCFAVIYAVIKTFVNERLDKKHLPIPTTFYMESDYIPNSPETNNGMKIKFVKKTVDDIYVEGKKVVRVTTEEEEEEIL